jgi:hypothetical protein
MLKNNDKEFASIKEGELNKIQVDQYESGTKTINKIRYSIGLISAIEFIQKKGEVIEQRDLEDLKKESVLILEFNHTSESNDIFEEIQSDLTKEDAVIYLKGEILKNITIEQNHNEFIPDGVSYEGSIGARNKIRLLLFFNDINVNESAKVVLYDNLFDNGLVKIKIN